MSTFLSIPSRYVFAYRPFVSTDADVAEKGELEIEIGLFGISHNSGTDEMTVPAFIANYGIAGNWELVSEFDVQIYHEGEGRNFELKEPAQFLKGVVREGVLQDKKGPSIALEIGVLIPSTEKESRKTGIEGIGIFSSGISDLIYHINIGGELDRERFAFKGLWGVILEKPVTHRFRFVVEVLGVVQRYEKPDNSCLLGFIGELKDFECDFGIRKGLSEAASDMELTTGITISF